MAFYRRMMFNALRRVFRHDFGKQPLNFDGIEGVTGSRKLRDVAFQLRPFSHVAAQHHDFAMPRRNNAFPFRNQFFVQFFSRTQAGIFNRNVALRFIAV